jgi:hypothetical protein
MSVLHQSLQSKETRLPDLPQPINLVLFSANAGKETLKSRISATDTNVTTPDSLMKDRNGDPERGSEWEPIKILFKNSAYEPDFTRAPPQASLAKFT